MQVFLGDPSRFGLPGCALTIGNFDGVHQGHRRMLQRLRQEAAGRGLPTAVLTFEPHPREFFSRANPPARLSTLRDKLVELEESGLVDYVFVFRFNHSFSKMTASEFIERVLVKDLKTRYLLIGDDFQFGTARQGNFELLASCPHFVTEAMPSVLVQGERASSTLVRQKLAAGDLEAANALLGDIYRLSGKVMHGKKLGRTIGFPTANIHLPHLKPALQGVFVVQADTPFGRLGGVASLGLNPTVSDTPDYKLEVHLFDFSGDLYGKRLTVRFLKKLRDEARYDDLATLVAQIERDAASAKTYLTSLQREQA
ncbi:bifunctional riboflavin kinase/FAD synthetase [Chromobacterium sp. IIBBL 290-4]|uniref:bifunctional riboflavin kinase/FAD synthetase n=1 Tax=Chromobacterium sp. IIBBL 290-4 TaxID=2953890 RepID=UPI0020B8AE5D|nr:bifunctional riboflavin kinase/FAD synthetase [Chromobacterium sp. IIBBL 290-4]UTH72533.1 bifunctional riboflavin kinase/FAD synthetase [Chromobacterium sp. IIBBL 290-4]